MKLAAFPKCYMDDLCVHRTMTIFDWIAIVGKELRPLGVTGLETYHGTLESHEPKYLARVRAAQEDARGPQRFAPFLRLYLEGNPLSDAAKGEQLSALKAAGVRVAF